MAAVFSPDGARGQTPTDIPPGDAAAPSAPNAGALPADPSPPAGAQESSAESVTGQAKDASGQQWDANALGKLQDSMKNHMAIALPAIKPEDLKTLFFTAWQYALLNEAKQLFTTRPPTSGEIAQSENPDAPRPTGPREISLGGIAYHDAKNWTVWLNNQRIKPDAIPKEVLDIKVGRDHIDLKWYDLSSNLIYPIRLRPHQRFNLDSRIFLPGTGT